MKISISDFVSAMKAKLRPEKLVLLEVHPLKKLPKSEQTNNQIYENLQKYIAQKTVKNQNYSCKHYFESNGKLK